MSVWHAVSIVQPIFFIITTGQSYFVLLCQEVFAFDGFEIYILGYVLV